MPVYSRRACFTAQLIFYCFYCLFIIVATVFVYCMCYQNKKNVCRSTILQQQFNRVGRVEHGSVALPGIMRSGSVGGPDNFNMGSMPAPQQQVTMGQMHRGHMPPLVRCSHCITTVAAPRCKVWFDCQIVRRVHNPFSCTMCASSESGSTSAHGYHKQQHAGGTAGSGGPRWGGQPATTGTRQGEHTSTLIPLTSPLHQS